MRTETLTTIKGGLNRLRTKGAALNDSLYDLLNGYVTTEKTVVVRPGTIRDHTLPAGTVGLVAFEGKLHVFASSDVSGIDNIAFELHLLRSPNGTALSKIHFAEPFLGALYVSAEFSDAKNYHFWLSPGTEWAASTDYDANDIVQPSVDNGFRYRATRLSNPYPSWSAGVPRAINDKIEPSTYNGLYFEVVQLIGTNSRSGDEEPDWDVAVGTLVTEDVDGVGTIDDPAPPDEPVPGEMPDIADNIPWWKEPGTINTGGE